MSQEEQPDDFLSRPSGNQPGDLDSRELWWAERQQALEAAGYMLRPRYRPGWIPSWRGTKQPYFTVEDGLPLFVSPLRPPSCYAHQIA